MSELDVSISFLSPQTFRDKLLNVSTTFALPNIDLRIETNLTLLKLKLESIRYKFKRRGGFNPSPNPIKLFSTYLTKYLIFILF